MKRYERHSTILNICCGCRHKFYFTSFESVQKDQIIIQNSQKEKT